jgi:hypothetical protein
MFVVVFLPMQHLRRNNAEEIQLRREQTHATFFNFYIWGGGRQIFTIFCMDTKFKIIFKSGSASKRDGRVSCYELCINAGDSVIILQHSILHM